MNLQRMKQLAGIKLNESVMAVPGMVEGDHDSSFGNPAPSFAGLSREELATQLAKLKSQFDPGFEFSDDQSYWRRQRSIRDNIGAIEKALGGMNEDESDMQTAATIGQNQDDAAFDMSIGSVTEEVTADDLGLLVMQYKSGLLTYDEFKEKLSSLEHADDSMRQGEMGMQGDDTPAGNRAFARDADDWNDMDAEMNDGDDEWDEREDGMFEEISQVEECLQNGYGTEKYANGEDYFPNGADGPVVKATGPSGAKQGDNPEQKKMQVAETHKELVYAYRSFLKEGVIKDSFKK